MRAVVFLLLIAFCACLVTGTAEAQVKTYKFGELDNNALAGARVAVSPRNSKNILAFGAGKFFVSNDAGATWKQSPLQLPADVKGTPNITVDSRGNFFVVYSTLNQIVSHNSTDDGVSWSEPVVIGAANNRDQYNPGIVANPRKEGLIVTWTQSGKYGLQSDTCKSNIMLSTSTNGGKKWSKAILVNQNPGNCTDDDFTVRASLPIWVNDGKMFVVWSGKGSMFFDRSYDGSMWISTDLTIREQVGGWALNIPGFGKVYNPPSATVDNSASRITGTLFTTYSDQSSGENDTDIWLTRSVNRGDNWTVPARINQDKPGRDQFLPKISIDPSTGFVYIVYFDRRDYSDNQTDVYLSWSTDGGNQFKEKKLTEKPFTPDINASDLMTDYIDLSVQKGLIVPVWTGFEDGKQQVWTAVIKFEELK